MPWSRSRRTPPRRPRWLSVPLLSLLLLAFAPPVLAAKTDIVVFTNGDRVTGEIKKLEAGILQYSTDTMGTVSIEWRFIETIITDKQQIIETVDGTRWLGKLQKPEGSEDVQVVTVRGPVEIDPRDMVSAWPVEATFLDKMDLKIGVGYDYARATDITNFNASADFLYRTDQRIVDASLRADLTRQPGVEEDQNRQEIRINHQRLLQDRKFRAVLAGYEVNEAIGLNRRLYAGGAFGRYLVKSNRNWLNAAAGLIATREQTVEREEVSSVEGLLAGTWRHFRFVDPERTLETSLALFPSLTESGRWRGNFRTTFRLELVSDLFWSMEYYYNFDSRPLDVGAQEIDYGINTGLGWSF
jgi:hypothetical protein